MTCSLSVSGWPFISSFSHCSRFTNCMCSVKVSGATVCAKCAQASRGNKTWKKKKDKKNHHHQETVVFINWRLAPVRMNKTMDNQYCLRSSSFLIFLLDSLSGFNSLSLWLSPSPLPSFVACGRSGLLLLLLDCDPVAGSKSLCHTLPLCPYVNVISLSYSYSLPAKVTLSHDGRHMCILCECEVTNKCNWNWNTFHCWHHPHTRRTSIFLCVCVEILGTHGHLLHTQHTQHTRLRTRTMHLCIQPTTAYTLCCSQ